MKNKGHHGQDARTHNPRPITMSMKKLLTRLSTRFTTQYQSRREQGNIPLVVMFVVLVGFVAPALAMATLSIHKTEQRTADEYSVSTFTTQCRIEQESLIQTRMRETGDVTSLLPTLTPCVYEISDDKFAVVEAEAVEQGGVVTLTLSSYYGLASDSTVYSFTLHQHIEEGWQVVGFTEDGVAIWGPPLDPPYETVQIPAEEYENPTPPEEDPEP